VVNFELLDPKERDRLAKLKRAAAAHGAEQPLAAAADSANSEKERGETNFTLEMNVAQAQKLYDAFEQMQKQLDALTDK
jgi:hypothetical protein